MARSINPTKQTAKAGKRVGKALSIFETAAAELEVASAEHLAVRDKLVDDAEVVLADAGKAYVDALQAADKAYEKAWFTADLLGELAGEAETDATNAQLQADNLRKLLVTA